MTTDENNELERLNLLENETTSLNIQQDQQSPAKDSQQNNHQNGKIIEGLHMENDKNSDVGSYLSRSSKSMASSAAARGATKVIFITKNWIIEFN